MSLSRTWVFIMKARSISLSEDGSKLYLYILAFRARAAAYLSAFLAAYLPSISGLLDLPVRTDLPIAERPIADLSIYERLSSCEGTIELSLVLSLISLYEAYFPANKPFPTRLGPVPRGN